MFKRKYWIYRRQHLGISQTWYISFNFNDIALNPAMNSSNLQRIAKLVELETRAFDYIKQKYRNQRPYLFFLHSSYCFFISSRCWVTKLRSPTRSLYSETLLLYLLKANTFRRTYNINQARKPFNKDKEKTYSAIESRFGFISFNCASSSDTISRALLRSQVLLRISSVKVAWSFSLSTKSLWILQLTIWCFYML